MATAAVDRTARVRAVLDRAEFRIRQAVLAAFAAARDALQLAELEGLVLIGDLEAVVARAVELGLVKLTSETTATMVLAGQGTSEFLERALRVTVAFDQVNQGAVDAIRDNNLRLIREVTEEQRLTVRTILSEGIEQGLNPRDTARLVRDSIGLTSKQAQAVRNYRALLEGLSSEALERELRDRRFDRTVARAVREGKPLTRAQISRMTSRYRERYLRYRAEVIGRTEALRSANQGAEESLRQAVEAGHVVGEQVEREWVATSDGRTRDSHRFLNGQVRLMGETWRGSDGELRYPGDPLAPASETVQCRCVLVTRIVRDDKEEE